MSIENVIRKAIYKLCVQANTCLPISVFNKLSEAYSSEQNLNAKQALALIIENAKLAYSKKMPLCQDTGQVIVFIKVPTNCPKNINELINTSVEKAYSENFYRKSVVKNAIFDRKNTTTNTPCIIYSELSNNNTYEINLLIKGAGSENVSTTEMLSPTTTEEELVQNITSRIKSIGAKACPPYFIGIGIGGTIEYAGLLSKKALLLDKNIDEQHNKLAEKIKTEVNKLNIGASGYGGASTALDVKLLTDFTHIANMPVALTINCHSFRHAKCKIEENQNIINSFSKEIYEQEISKTSTLSSSFENYRKVNTSDIKTLKSLKKGQKILLSGEIYTARDMAHKRLSEMISQNKPLPFELKNKIIFYAGPCPCKSCNVTGSIGPTTSSRMDKFLKQFYSQGLLATIGKGERSKEAENIILNSGGIYFTAIGGIACLLAESFIKKDLIAFDDLGTEAVFRFEIKNLPLTVALA